MTNALERAYASNEETPIHTLEIIHSALTGGVLRLAQSFVDVTATLETGGTVTFNKAGINISLPDRTTDGAEELDLQINNTDNSVWPEIKAVVDANRTGDSAIVCKYRAYLLSDTSAPASATYILTVRGSSINRVSASIKAAYTPIPDITWPRYRYYPSQFPGVKYA